MAVPVVLVGTVGTVGTVDTSGSGGTIPVPDLGSSKVALMPTHTQTK